VAPTIGGARREGVAVEEGWGNMNYEPGFAIALRRIYILNLIKSFYDRLIIFPKKNYLSDPRESSRGI
jgi:hypothetical protein